MYSLQDGAQDLDRRCNGADNLASRVDPRRYTRGSVWWREVDEPRIDAPQHSVAALLPDDVAPVVDSPCQADAEVDHPATRRPRERAGGGIGVSISIPDNNARVIDRQGNARPIGTRIDVGDRSDGWVCRGTSAGRLCVHGACRTESANEDGKTQDV